MKLFALALAVMISFTVLGGNDADSVKVYFRVGQSQFDPSLGDNREKMDSCMADLKAYAESDIERVIVRAYASPDGTSRTNTILARERCDAISDYIVAHAGINPKLIQKIPEGIAWQGLRDLVQETPEVPDREAVLDILDNTPVWVYDSKGRIVDSRKSRLMSLARGVPYNWMLKHLFPELRNAVAIVVVTKNGVNIGHDREDTVKDEEQEQEILTGEDENDADVIGQPDLIEPVSETTESAVKRDRIEHIALKTNLLFYAILMPNIEIEWMFADRWSAALEFQGAWYAKNEPHKVYRLSTLTPEVRYWVINRSRWHGMYTGIFAGGGLYDLCNGKKEGHEGEGIMVGVSAGYMWPISKHFSLDAGLGIGYLRARDKQYQPLDGHFLYQLTKNINYFGPLRLKLSLVWRI